MSPACLLWVFWGRREADGGIKAAHFVETCVAKYEGFLAQATSSSSLPLPIPTSASSDTPSTDTHAAGGQVFVKEGPGKELLNLLTLISELYNFQVISCVLVYDIIRGLLAGNMVGEGGERGEVGELGVEGVLRVVRSEFCFLRSFPFCVRDFLFLRGLLFE